MKAVQLLRYGPPESLAIVDDVPVPTPGAGQALVRVMTTSVNPADWHAIRGDPAFARLMSGLRRPKHPGIGADYAGVVEAVGPDVTNVAPGDEVLGLSIRTWAELVVVKADGIARKPAGLSWEDAGVIGVAALTALQGLRDKGHLAAGQRVLIAGAGGGVGHFAVQIAKALGAHVTATTGAAHLEMVRGLGADEVLDYATADPTRGRPGFDVIFDAGGWLSLRQHRRALRTGGRAVMAGAGAHVSLPAIAARFIAAKLLNRVGSRQYISYIANRTPESMATLQAMLEAGQLRPVIDRRYGLDEIRAAVTYQETGQANGKVAVRVAA